PPKAPRGLPQERGLQALPRSHAAVLRGHRGDDPLRGHVRSVLDPPQHGRVSRPCAARASRRVGFGTTLPTRPVQAGQAGARATRGGWLFATVTTTDTGSEPLASGTIIAEEMERWLRDLEGFQGFLVLVKEGQALGITFWASREVAERLAGMRSRFRERAL